MTLHRLYVIVDDVVWLERLLPAGVKLVQLRMKDRPVSHMRAQILRAQRMTEEYNAMLVINDHWSLAIECGCQWVHLGQQDLDTADVDAIGRAGLRLGISTHDEAECDRAISFNPGYVAFGPISTPGLKAMAWAEQGTGKLRALKTRLGACSLVAIGGLTVDRAREALAAGADCVAVSTAIVKSSEPEREAGTFLTAVA